MEYARRMLVKVVMFGSIFDNCICLKICIAFFFSKKLLSKKFYAFGSERSLNVRYIYASGMFVERV